MQKDYNFNSKEGMKTFFNENVEFAEYVARFAVSQKITVDEALEMAVVRERAIDLVNRY